MKILFISPPDMTTEPVIESLTGHETHIHRYGHHNIPVDIDMLNAADRLRPDLIAYIGCNDPLIMASVETFKRLQSYCPTVLICHDASDKTWTPVLTEYLKHDAFSLVVAIDGNETWPQRPQDYTALTPIPVRFYRDASPLHSRMVPFGFAGGYASQSRRDIVEHLRAEAGLVVPRRDERYGSYGEYARFLLRTRIVLNVPWSGSDNAAQVKGRVLEAGFAGCVLLEHEQSAARHWFNAGIDYAVYRDKEDAVEQVKRIISEPDWMTSLAHNLSTRVTQEHHPDIFWSKLFRGVGLNV